MQTSSHVEKDNWDDLASKQPIINIRTKGTYKPVSKPVIPSDIVKPCDMDNPVCPIDNQPIPVPCNLCPVNDMINESDKCHNCHSLMDDSSLYGSRGIMEILLPEKEAVNVDVKTPKKTVRKTTSTKKTSTKKTTSKSKKTAKE